jgi:hypothetical protein
VITYMGDADLFNRLIGFLASPECRAIYSRFGWIHGELL